MMMVAMNPTKTVRPMATVAPNPDTVSVSKLDRNLSAEPSCSSVSGWVENLASGSVHKFSSHRTFFSTSEQQYWLEQEPQQKSGQDAGIRLSSPAGLHSSPWAPGGGGSTSSSNNRVRGEATGTAMARQTDGRADGPGTGPRCRRNLSDPRGPSLLAPPRPVPGTPAPEGRR